MDISYLYWLVNSKIAERKSHGPHDPAAGIDVVVACLAEMREAATRRGARFHVLTHHLVEIAPMAESRWADFLRRSGASTSPNASACRITLIRSVTTVSTGASQDTSALPRSERAARCDLRTLEKCSNA